MPATRVALGAATLWSIGLVVAALTAPVYSGEAGSTDPTGALTTTRTSATLVEVNGWSGVVVATLPLAAALAVAALLLLRGRLGAGAEPWLVAAAWALSATCAALGVLALTSIGALVLPVAAGLGLAVATSHPRAVAAGSP